MRVFPRSACGQFFMVRSRKVYAFFIPCTTEFVTRLATPSHAADKCRQSPRICVDASMGSQAVVEGYESIPIPGMRLMWWHSGHSFHSIVSFGRVSLSCSASMIESSLMHKRGS